jgi:hypothetical protein
LFCKNFLPATFYNPRFEILIEGLFAKPLMAFFLFLLTASAITTAFGAQLGSSDPLSVVILSPAINSPFNRGEAVIISASVSSLGSPVIGATVTANTPTGGTIFLQPTSNQGVYSAQYTVLPTDPSGMWTLTVQAISGSQVASAHESLLVSQGLNVLMISPPQNSQFTIGQTVTIRSTITYQDNQRILPSASVSFNKPRAGLVSMTVDPSDASGKTWLGAYTIVSADVPVNGITWFLTVTATVNGNTGIAFDNVKLYGATNQLAVDVLTYDSSAYTTQKNTFAAGQTVFVKASVTRPDSTTVTGGSVSFVITGTSIANTAQAMTFNPSVNAWTGAYTLLGNDVPGIQAVTVAASDFSGDSGTGFHEITVTTTGLSVVLNSPASGTAFNRGQTVSITALVELSGSPLAGATVTANAPNGGTIVLTNSGGGTYTAQHVVSSSDPTGNWAITAHATFGAQSASSAPTSVLLSNSLKVGVSTWSSSSFTQTKDNFVTGDTVFILARVSLQDNTPVGAGNALATISGTSLANSPRPLTFSSSLNGWVGSYTILGTDATGTQVVTVTAADSFSNSGSGTHSIGINAVVAGQQPLEAVITYDPQHHDIAVLAACNPGCVGPTTVSLSTTQTNGHGHGDHEDDDDRGGGVLRTYTVADSAGHTVTIKMTFKNDGSNINAQLLTLQYGTSAPIQLRHASLSFSTASGDDEDGRSLDQSVSTGDSTRATAHFDANTDTTTITLGSQDSHGDDEGDGNSFTKSGMWLLELATSGGSLNIGYFQSSS